MNRIVTIIAVFVVVAAAIFGYLTQKKMADTPRGIDAGHVQPVLESSQIRPDFSLPDILGVQRQLSEWDGKTIVVNFWATWCPPCRKEIPVLIKAQQDYADAGLQIIGIAVDEMEPVKTYSEQMNINYPVLVGEQEALDAADAFGVEFTALPFTIIIRPDRGIDAVHFGELDEVELLGLVGEYLR